MSGQLQRELHQGKPFASPEAELALNILRTAGELIRATDQILKPYALTSTQYNVLRILRGAGPEGTTCSTVAARLINRQPDVTRLLDRLEKSGLLARTRSPADRRVTTVTITARALRLLEALEEPLRQMQLRQFARLAPAQLQAGIQLLETVRESLDHNLND